MTSNRSTAPSPRPVVAVTGAGSGIGRAVALHLAREGWTVALLGRRAGPLEQVASQCGPTASVHRVDVGQWPAVEKAFDEILSLHGRLDAVVAAAGVNIAERSWSRLGVEGYREILQANLDGVFHCIRAALPALRRQSCGTVIAINSEAGRTATAKAGAAYVAAKFGLAGLIQSLNAEERAHGIRGVSIFPGDVSTPLLDRRPEPPSVEARARMVQPEDIAACVYLALTLPPRAIIEELVIRPAG